MLLLLTSAMPPLADGALVRASAPKTTRLTATAASATEATPTAPLTAAPSAAWCPPTEGIERLVGRIAEACEAWMAHQGFGAEDEGDAADDDAQAGIHEAPLRGQEALGERAGQRPSRAGAGRVFPPQPPLAERRRPARAPVGAAARAANAAGVPA